MPGISDPRREFKPEFSDQIVLGDHERRLKALQAQHGGSAGGSGGPHAATHATDGADPLTPGMIGAAPATHTHPAYETELADHETRILWLEDNGVGPGGGGSGSGTGGVWLHGFGTPPNTLGSDGDFYMDVGSTAYFGPKAAGAWPAGIELQGPPGIQGEPGADSTVPGPAGRDGVDGAPGSPGGPGPAGKSAYDLWVEAGNSGGVSDFLTSLRGADGADSTVPGPAGRDGVDGRSAYQVWLDAGHTGTVSDYLDAIKGATGATGATSTVPGPTGPAGPASTVPGPTGPAGADGRSAYQVWLDAGNAGTVTDYLASLKGAKGDTGAASTVPGPTGPAGAASTVPGPTGATGAAGKSAYQVWLDAGNSGTVNDYLAALKGATGAAGQDGRGWYSGYVDPPATLANDGDFYLNMTTNVYWHKESGAWVSQNSLVGPSTGAAGGDLTGNYPNPTVAAGAITDAKVAGANKDGAAGTASMRTLGTAAQQAAAGNDARLSDKRSVADRDRLSIRGEQAVTGGGTFTVNGSNGRIKWSAVMRVAGVGRDTTTINGASLSIPILNTGDVIAAAGTGAGGDTVTVDGLLLSQAGSALYAVPNGNAATLTAADLRIVHPGNVAIVPSEWILLLRRDFANSSYYVVPPGVPVKLGTTYVSNEPAAALAVTDAHVATANKDGLAATPSMRTLGTAAQQAAAGNHTHTDMATVTGGGAASPAATVLTVAGDGSRQVTVTHNLAKDLSNALYGLARQGLWINEGFQDFGGWFHDLGAGVMPGRDLLMTATGEKLLAYDRDGLALAAFSDCVASYRWHYNGAAPTSMGLVVRRRDRNTLLMCQWAPGVGIRLFKRTAGAYAQLGATVALPALAASTDYWCHIQASGDTITAKHFTSNPRVSSPPAAAATLSYTLTSTDTPTFSKAPVEASGSVSSIGIQTQPADTLTELGDFVVTSGYDTTTWYPVMPENHIKRVELLSANQLRLTFWGAVPAGQSFRLSIFPSA